MKIRAKMDLINKNGLVAVGDVYLDEVFVIHQVKMLSREREDGKQFIVIELPRRKKQDKWVDFIILQSSEIKKQIEEAVQQSIKEELLRSVPIPQLQVAAYPLEKGIPLNGYVLKGYATVVYENAIEFRNIRIMEKDGTEWVAYPGTEVKRAYQQLISPASLFLKESLEQDILEKYHEELEKQKQKSCAERGNDERSK